MRWASGFVRQRGSGQLRVKVYPRPARLGLYRPPQPRSQPPEVIRVYVVGDEHDVAH